MTKYAHLKSSSTTFFVKGVSIVLLLTGLVFAMYQMKYGNFEFVSQASNPCSAYTKYTRLGSSTGVVQKKGNGKFVWIMNGNRLTPKVVVVCAETTITSKLGRSARYQGINIGDSVELAGWYGDTTNTTILAQWIRHASTESPASTESLASPARSSVSSVDQTNTGSSTDQIQPPSTHNPFGIMISGNTTQIKVQTAKALGAVYYRPLSIFLDRWKGQCEECDAAVSGGLKLILTVRNNGSTGIPTTPPVDWTRYREVLTQILTKYRPEILVIENEENSGTLFYSGTTQQYLEELKVGCAVAHQYGIQCANGGLVSSLVVALVSESYRQNGDMNKATNYLNTALVGERQSIISMLGTSKGQEQLAKGRELLQGYKDAQADYLNFHWYVADTNSLTEAVQYLRTISKLPVMTNEVGQQGTINATQVTNVMQKLIDLGIPYAIWFSMDSNGGGQAMGLSDANGTLRPNGKAFAEFINNTY